MSSQTGDTMIWYIFCAGDTKKCTGNVCPPGEVGLIILAERVCGTHQVGYAGFVVVVVVGSNAVGLRY